MTVVFNFLMCVCVIAVILFAVGLLMYNRLVALKTETERAWKNIDVQLQRRYDLIPNLVASVKKYASHEKSIFDNLAEARKAFAEACSERSPQKAAVAEKLLSRAVGSITAVAEQYPDLKASQNFASLQEELVSTENKVAYVRDYYNSAVALYNAKIKTVPFNVVASLFNFKAVDYFEAESEEVRSAPKVSELYAD